MCDVITDFVARFHNLPGDTVKEKQQNLFKLLHEYRHLQNDSRQLDAITANLQANNHLEKIFRADFLIYFHRFDELYNDFKKGHDITVKKLSKQVWFYERAYKKLSCDDLIKTILPTSSYSLKVTILKKLPLDETKADFLFDGVLQCYGLPLSTILLSKCSSSKIAEIFKKYPIIKLTVAQLQAIFDKDPSLITTYLEEKTKQNGNVDFINFNPILIYIAQKNPQLFSDLFKKYHFRTSLGCRTTKRYVHAQKNEVLDDKNAYLKILNKGATIRKMGTEMSDLLFEKQTEFQKLYWKSLLKFYPKNRQFEVFESVFNKLHRYNFGENINEISEEELRLIPDAKWRQELALRKRQQECNNEYLRYVTPKLCLDELMSKINHITGDERAKYIEYATTCGFVNDDVDLLLKVCELVAVRLKNDAAEMRKSFLTPLYINRDKLCLFDERHWKFVLEIFAIMEAKSEYFYHTHRLTFSHLQYLVKNEKSVKDVVQNISDLDRLYQDNLDKDSKTLKVTLSALLEQGLQKKPSWNEEFAANIFDCTLVYYCHRYNKKHRDSPIENIINLRIKNSVQNLLQAAKDTYLTGEAIRGLELVVCSGSDSEVESMKTLYFPKLESYGRMSGVMWFAKHDPAVFAQHFDKFLTNFVLGRGLNTRRFWRYIKKCTYLDLDKKTIEFCRQKLTEEGYNHKVHLVRPLTMLSPTESHLEFIKQYKPVSDKVDLTDDDVKELYELQGKVVRLLHYVACPREVLEATFDFCRGDYLQFALSPLYSSIYRLPENETKEFIAKLNMIKALSVRKHATALSCVVYNEEDVKKCLREATVPALLSTIRYFVQNPSDDLWWLVEAKLKALDKNQLSLLKVALKLQIPAEYKSRFVETVWEVLDKHDDKEIWRILFTTIDRCTVCNFTPEFALKTIKNSLFRLDEALPVVTNILLFTKTPEKYTLLHKILTDLKTYWNHSELGSLARQKLSDFIKILFKTYMKEKNTENQYVLTSTVTNIFSFTEAFEEIIALQLMPFKNQTFDDCARRLASLNKEIVEIYGTYAVELLVNFLHAFVFQHVYCKEEEKIRLCHSLLQLQPTVNDWLLILGLIPNVAPIYKEPFILYEEILKALNEVPDDVVHLKRNLFLKNLRSKGKAEWNFSCDN